MKQKNPRIWWHAQHLTSHGNQFLYRTADSYSTLRKQHDELVNHHLHLSIQITSSGTGWMHASSPPLLKQSTHSFVLILHWKTLGNTFKLHQYIFQIQRQFWPTGSRCTKRKLQRRRYPASFNKIKL